MARQLFAVSIAGRSVCPIQSSASTLSMAQVRLSLEYAACIPEPEMMPLPELLLFFERRARFCRSRASLYCVYFREIH